MKLFAIGAIFLVGCATGCSESMNQRHNLSLEQAQQTVDQDEEECIEKVADRGENQMSNIVMTLGTLSQMEIQAVSLQRAEAWSQCVANANQGNEAIAAAERTKYENAEALDRKIPLPVLTMSLSP